MPKIVDHARRREEIARLTVQVIQNAGIDAATIRSIARRGGFSSGVLTHYFTNKDELIAFAFRWLAERSFADLDRALKAAAPGADRIRAALEFMVPQAGTSTGIAVWVTLWERALRNPRLAREHHAYYRRWRACVRRLVRDLVRRDESLPGLKVADATELLVSAADGLFIAAAFEPQRFSRARRRALLRALVATVARPAPAAR
jgi:AcrR family transcriptional regulator